MCDIIATWPSLEQDGARHVQWARELWGALDRVSTGRYVNHLGDDEIADARGYASSQHARLAALEARWAPENVFRLNPNVRPAVTA